LKARSPIN